MKKLLLVVAAAVVSTGAFAQFTKGDIFLNAQTTSLNLGFTDNDGYSSTDFNLGVQGGYFFTDRLAADVTLGFNYGKMEEFDAETNFALGIGVRYHFYDAFFARVGFGAESYKNELDKTKFDTAFDLSVGYDWFINEKVFFEPSLYFAKGLSEFNKKTSTFGLRVGIGVKF